MYWILNEIMLGLCLHRNNIVCIKRFDYKITPFLKRIALFYQFNP